MSYQVDSYGNAYFPAGVSVKSIPATTGTQAKVLVPGVNGRISSATIAQLVTQSGGNIVSSIFGRTGVVVAKEGDYTTDQITESGGALYFSTSRVRKSIYLTTFNTSGPATYDSNTGILNIPQYGSGAASPTNFVPLTRTITINGQTADLSVDRIFSVASMVYPSAGIALSNGVSWEPSITNNSANWNTAFGWGDHTVAGYVPYTGANADVDLGSNNFTSKYLTANGAPALAGVLNLKQDAISIPKGNGFSSIAAGLSSFDFYGYTGASTYKYFQLRFDALTDNTTRLFTLPDASGTIALTTDLSSYVSLTGSYSNPTWLTDLDWAKITGAPAFLTSYTETDPVWTSEKVNYYTKTAADARYLQSYTETDPVWTSEKANYALKTYVDTSISNLVDSAPGTLDTLNELAAALGDDANFSTTITTLIGTKEPAITAGTTAQYWRGDKSWQTLPIYTLSGLGGVPTTRTLTINGTAYNLSADREWTINSMVYPAVGIAVSTGTAWGTSITDNSTNWNSAFTDRFKWDGGATGLVAATGRTSLGLGTAATANTGDFAAASHTHSIANVTGLQTALDGKENTFTKNTAFNKNFGTTAGTVTEGNDARLSDSRTPLAHTHPISDITGLQTALDGKQASLGFTPYNSTNPSGYITGYSETDTLASVTGRGATTSTAVIINNNLAVNTASPYATGTYSLDVNGGLLVKNTGRASNITLINADPSGGGNHAFVIHTVSGTSGSSLVDIQGYYGANVVGSTTIRLNPLGGNVTVNGYTVYHTGNVPTFNQSTTGNAATATKLASGQSTWLGTGVIDSVVGMLVWKNYGNSHVIFDASASTNPSGGGVNSTNSSVPWTATYPTLMGWNGNQTYGVRVDSARLADSASSVAWGNVTGRPTALSSFTNDLGNYGGWITSSGSISGTASNITAYTINQSVGSGNSPTFAGLTVSGPVYQGLSNQGVISLLSDVIVSQTNNYFRLYLPQGYYDNRNGGTATIKIVWGMLHAGITYSQEYKLTFGTNHGAGGNYLIVSDVTRTYKDQNPDSYGGYLMDQTPAVDFYNDMSGGYINFNVKGVQSYNTHRVVAVDIVGGGVGTPTLTYYGTSSPGGSALTVKDIPYATTAGSANSVAWTNVSSRPTALSSFTNDVALPLNGNWVGNTGMNDQKLYLRTNGDENHYLWNAADDWEELVAYFGTGFRIKASNATTLATFTTSGLTVTGYISASGALTVGGVSTLNSAVNINRHIDANTTWGSCISIFVGWSSSKVILGNNANSGHDYALNLGCNSVVSTNAFYCHQDITAFSDARVKENVQIVDNALDKIQAIRGVTFTRNDTDDIDKRHVGVIAQEVLAVLPEAVSEDDRGYYSVAYGNMAALFIEAIKEQQAQIEEMKKEIKELKNK